MRKIILAANVLLLFSTNLLFSQAYYMTKPEGFGAGTTGGGNASPVTVNSYNALKTALTSGSAAVILVSGTIDFSSSGMIKAAISNKTVIGLPGAKFVNTNQSTSGILYLNTGSSNVIIRNILFVGPGAWDNNGNDNLTIKPASKVWVDHCEFQDGEDGNLDISNLSDNITVSWCKFTYLKSPRPAGSGTTNDHRFSNLIGGSDSDFPSDGRYSVTWQNCYWANGCVERMPRARNAELHILNCYHNTNTGSVALGLGGGSKGTTCYVENSHFAKVSSVYRNYNGTVDLTFSGCIGGVSNVGSASKPSYSYSTYPASQVASAVTGPCGAGPTLKVSSTGQISYSCLTTDILDNTAISSISSLVFPNPSSGQFSVRPKEDANMAIFDLAGNVVITEENLSREEDREIQADLPDGIYFVRLQYKSGSSETIKFARSKR